MNISKVGMVSREQNTRGNSGMRLNPYTLCEYQVGRTRNGSRYGFARKSGFDIPAISRRTTPTRTLPVEKSGFVVIPGLSPTSRTTFQPSKTLQSRTSRGTRRFYPHKTTVPPLQKLFNGFAGRFLSVAGGCHE